MVEEFHGSAGKCGGSSSLLQLSFLGYNNHGL